MKPSPPNKEIVRRICILFQIKQCWMTNPSQYEASKLLVSLDNKKIDLFKKELKDWSGINFDVYSVNSKSTFADDIKLNGIILLPLELDTALMDINRRSKEKIKAK